MKTRKKSFLVIGTGSFGHHLCRALAGQNCEIMIVDKDAEQVEDLLPYVASAKIADCTNPDVLKNFAVESFDTCFVCIDEDFMSSLQITSLLKELGAKKVYGKAKQDIQAKFLLRNGADQIIYLEQDVAESIAVSESFDNIFDCIELSSEYSIYELAPKDSWVGKTVLNLNFRSQYNLSIIAAKRGDVVTPMTNPDYVLRSDEHLIVLGHLEDIRRALN